MFMVLKMILNRSWSIREDGGTFSCRSDHLPWVAQRVALSVVQRAAWMVALSVVLWAVRSDPHLGLLSAAMSEV